MECSDEIPLAAPEGAEIVLARMFITGSVSNSLILR
jgi:hypothetical protein